MVENVLNVEAVLCSLKPNLNAISLGKGMRRVSLELCTQIFPSCRCNQLEIAHIKGKQWVSHMDHQKSQYKEY